MILCYVGIGSNLDHPRQQVRGALEALATVPGIRLRRRSPWYQSKAVGPGEQADYINGVIELETTLAPLDLLRCLQQIETQQGRERHVRWGPRTLDLDILLYGELCLQTAELQIPHPRMAERAFVLAPLATLNPQLQLPASPNAFLPNAREGKSATIAALLAALTVPAAELRLLDGEHEVVQW